MDKGTDKYTQVIARIHGSVKRMVDNETKLMINKYNTALGDMYARQLERDVRGLLGPGRCPNVTGE